MRYTPKILSLFLLCALPGSVFCQAPKRLQKVIPPPAANTNGDGAAPTSQLAARSQTNTAGTAGQPKGSSPGNTVAPLNPNAAGNLDVLVDIPNVQDPAKAEIVSVHLYMTGQEAIAALRQKFHAPVGPMSLMMTCESGRICVSSGPAHMTPQKRFIDTVRYESDQVKVALYFQENFPFEASKPEILDGMTYTPVLRTSADSDAFFQQLIKKYGTPTNQEPPWSAQWCVRGEIATRMDRRTVKQVPVGYRCDGRAPFLKFDAGYLQLSDPTISPPIIDKWNHQRTASAPPL